MLSNADHILPVGMRWIHNFFYYRPVTVTIHSGDMNKNLKSKFASLIVVLIRLIYSFIHSVFQRSTKVDIEFVIIITIDTLQKDY
jgi:hypothetical protein